MGSVFDRMGGRPPLRPFLRAAAAFARGFSAANPAQRCSPSFWTRISTGAARAACD